MVAQAPRYGLTLLVEDCRWECRWCQADGCSLAHNGVCVDRGGLAGGGWGSRRLPVGSVTDSCAITPWRKGAHASRAIARKARAGTPCTNYIALQEVVMQNRAASMTTLDKLDPSLMGRIRISTMMCYASYRALPNTRRSIYRTL